MRQRLAKSLFFFCCIFLIANITVCPVLAKKTEEKKQEEEEIKIPVTKIVFENTFVFEKTLKKGVSKKIKYTVYPADATNKKIKWKSTNKSVVKVTAKGKIKTKKTGTAMIIARAKDGSGVVAKIKITVGVPVKKIKTDTRYVKCNVGDTKNLLVSLKPINATNKKLKFISENKGVAKVNSSGKITAMGAGTTKIHIKSKDGWSQTAVTIKVTSKTYYCTVGLGKTTLMSSVVPVKELGKDIKWKSANKKIAVVYQSGRVKGIAGGKVKITATTKSFGTKRATIKVSVGSKVKTITPKEPEMVIELGESEKIGAAIAPVDAANKKLLYSTSNATVATVTARGTVSGMKVGTTTIIVKSQDGGAAVQIPVKVIHTKPLLYRTTSDGQILGKKINDDVIAWRGVPYARPPVGELRWKAPQDNVKWSGILETKYYASMATQLDDGVVIGSEDCLYMNIYRPNTTEANLPVMVYIHGGNNLTDSSRAFTGDVLAVSANTIIVSIDYRLGAFGFLNAEALKTGDKEDDSGNYGLLDIKKALEWIKKNAAAFGGNPNNITLAGVSAGARNIMAAIISPSFKGLFQKAIVLSGGMTTSTPEEGQKSAAEKIQALAVKKGYDDAWYEKASAEEIKTFLYSLSTEEVAGLYTSFSNNMSKFPQLFTDGYVVPTEGFAVLESGDYNQVPMILGSTKSEHASKIIGSRYFKELKTAIYTAQTVESVLDDLYIACKEYGSQLYSGFNVERVAEKMTANNTQPPIYAYRFSWGDNADAAGSLYAKYIGSYHCSDIHFIRANWANSYTDLQSDVYGRQNQEGREALSLHMQQYIGNFLRSGNPNGIGLSEQWMAWNDREGEEKIMIFQATKTADTSYMSPEYLKDDDIWAEMKETLSEENYAFLTHKMFINRFYFASNPEINNGDTGEDDFSDDEKEEIFLLF